jgi:hypothetical protein
VLTKGRIGTLESPVFRWKKRRGPLCLMRVSLLLCVNAREGKAYDDGGGGGTPVAVVAVVAAAAAEAGEEGAESGRERHFLCRLEKRKKEGEEVVIV